MVRGQAATGASTLKATLLEPNPIRRFCANSLLAESDGESLASGVAETEKDSNSAVCCPTFLPHNGGRMTYVMWLTNLAPKIQEATLFLPRGKSGPDMVKETEVRQIASVLDWQIQRGKWHDLFATAKSPECGN